MSKNQNLEQKARDKIDEKLVAASWVIQDKKEKNLGAAKVLHRHLTIFGAIFSLPNLRLYYFRLHQLDFIRLYGSRSFLPGGPTGSLVGGRVFHAKIFGINTIAQSFLPSFLFIR